MSQSVIKKLFDLYQAEKAFTQTDIDQATALFNEFNLLGYNNALPSVMLSYSLKAFIYFLHLVYESKKLDGTVPSPITTFKNSRWMLNSSFCFLNIRAVSPNPEAAGKITDALKLIPILRVDSIHLAPFFANALGNLYATESWVVIAPEIVDQELVGIGFSAQEQLQLLTEGIHLLNKKVGFDLEPHCSQFSRVVLMNPQCFRWIKLDSNKKGLVNGLSQEQVLADGYQNKFYEEIKEIVIAHLQNHGLPSLEDASEPEKNSQCHLDIVKDLIDRGLWTIPSHTWNGVGIPEFDYYHDYNYPVFKYLDKNGEDQSGQAFGMLTPIKFYNHLAINRIDMPNRKPALVKESQDLVNSLFPSLYERYRFDFVRFDYVDHIFDSVWEGDYKIPISDRPTPYNIQQIIKSAKSCHPAIGTMAERMDSDIDVYSEIGFDLILGIEVLTNIHQEYLRWTIGELAIKIKQLKSLNPSSILFAVDTHDSAHPLFWAKTVAERKGSEGMKLRLFLSRFMNVGDAYRPKYEVIGNQDLSSGLYEANNVAKSITWVGDKGFSKFYHHLENVQNSFRKALLEGVLSHSVVTDKSAYWFIDYFNSDKDIKERLIALIHLENDDKQGEEENLQGPEFMPEHDIQIDVNQHYFSTNQLKCKKISFDGEEDTLLPIDIECQLRIGTLQPKQFFLFHITEI